MQTRENREVLKFVGAGLVAVIVGAWTVFTYLDGRDQPKDQPAQTSAETGSPSDQISPITTASNDEYYGDGIDIAFAGMQNPSGGSISDLPRLVLEFVSFASKPVSIDMVFCNFNKWPVPNTTPTKTLNASVEIFPTNGAYIELNPEEKKTVPYELFVQSDSGVHGESSVSSCKVTYFIKTSSNNVVTRTASVRLGN